MNTETFEDRLLARLTELDAARPTADVPPATSRPRRRLAVLVPAIVTALIVIAMVGIVGLGRESATGPGSGSAATDPDVTIKPASFTVVKNADGSVTFAVRDLLDLSGATRALNDAGIVGRVVTSTADCSTGPNVVPIDPADLYPPDTTHRLSRRDGITGDDVVTVRSSDYPPGGGLLVVVDGGYLRFTNTLHLFVGYLAYVDANKIPQCVNFVDPGSGDVPLWPPQPR